MHFCENLLREKKKLTSEEEVEEEEEKEEGTETREHKKEEDAGHSNFPSIPGSVDFMNVLFSDPGLYGERLRIEGIKKTHPRYHPPFSKKVTTGKDLLYLFYAREREVLNSLCFSCAS